MSDPESLDELIRLYESAPSSFRQNLYISRAGSKGSKVTIGSIGPMTIPNPLDEFSIWRGVADRLGGEGNAVVKLSKAGSDTTAFAIALEMTGPMYQTYRTPQVQQPAPLPPPPPPQPYYQQLPPAPPVDAMTVVLKSLEGQNKLISDMVTEIRTPRPDQSLESVRQQLKEVQNELREERNAKKDHNNDYIELVRKSAGGNSGVPEAVANIISGPVDKLATAIAETSGARVAIEKAKVDVTLIQAKMEASKVDIEKIKAEGELQAQQTKFMEAQNRNFELALKAKEAGLRVNADDDDEEETPTPA